MLVPLDSMPRLSNLTEKLFVRVPQVRRLTHLNLWLRALMPTACPTQLSHMMASLPFALTMLYPIPISFPVPSMQLPCSQTERQLLPDTIIVIVAGTQILH